jgi:hypothetical protein
MIIAALALLVLLVVTTIIVYPYWRDRQILRAPFPDHWLLIVERKLPFFSKLANAEKEQLLNMIKLFVAKKNYYGCAGLEINDEIRLTIAAEACILLLNRMTGIYPKLHHILVYPHAFKAEHQQ